MPRNCKAEFGGIEKADSGECVREAREIQLFKETSRTISVIQIDVNNFLLRGAASFNSLRNLSVLCVSAFSAFSVGHIEHTQRTETSASFKFVGSV
jgi:hypothetical protein